MSAISVGSGFSHTDQGHDLDALCSTLREISCKLLLEHGEEKSARLRDATRRNGETDLLSARRYDFSDSFASHKFGKNRDRSARPAQPNTRRCLELCACLAGTWTGQK